MKSVVVTGASTGIGWGVTKVLIAKKVRVFGSVRSRAAGQKLKNEFGELFVPLEMDVRDRQAVQRSADLVATMLAPDERLWGLVNNAGVAHFGPLALQPIEQIKDVLEINVVGAIQVTQCFLPLLGMDQNRRSANRSASRIVNVSSIAGKIGTPFLGAYAASKHAMEGWSESLRRELMPYDIDVIVMGPGSVATPIWDKAEVEGMEIYRGTDYEIPLQRFQSYMLTVGRQGLSPEVLGEGIWKILIIDRPCVRYTLTPGKFKNWILPRLLPKRWVDRGIFKKLFGPTIIGNSN